MKELALPSKGAPSLGDEADKPGGKCQERVDLGTQRRRRQGRAFPVAGSTHILQLLGFSKPSGLQPGKERTGAGT